MTHEETTQYIPVEPEVKQEIVTENASFFIFQRRAVIIANPTAGSYLYNRRQLEETMVFLRDYGWEVELKLTHAIGDARFYTREAVANRFDVVIAAGGDGTINEVIQELVGSETALGVLPTGTANVWAREMGIPLDIAGASEILTYGRTRRIDVGSVNGRYFLLMVGIGFDGEVARVVERKFLKRLGIVGYLLVSFWLSFGYDSFAVNARIGEQEIKTRALQIVVGNTQLYGGAVKFTWQAQCDDGLLDVCIVRKRSKFRRIFIVLDFLLRRKQRSQWVSYDKSATIEVQTRKPVAIQVDGDSCGNTPATFTMAPRALKVIVPRRAPKGLFTED
ncbi:MAG TPA: diacylglycerol kinase family protein [Ktedonobacteraceae bacterium]|nr:diacylglycerol kinase family protein [Ktedonobacteraceae bacterium]